MKRNNFSGILVIAVVILLFIVDIYYQSLLSNVPFWQADWFGTRALIFGFLLAFGGTYIFVQRSRKARKRQEEFSAQLIRTQEEGLRKLASHLHDSLQQNLLFLKNEMTQIEIELGAEMNQRFGRFSKTLQDTIEDVREITSELYPHQLENLGMKKALEALTEKIGNSHGISISRKISEIDGLFSKEQAIDFYRVIQELLNNIWKHSRANNASVEIYTNSMYLEAVVADDGKGIERIKRSDSNDSFGFQSMQERLRLLGGKMKVASKPNGGTKIRISIPLRNR